MRMRHKVRFKPDRLLYRMMILYEENVITLQRHMNHLALPCNEAIEQLGAAIKENNKTMKIRHKVRSQPDDYIFEIISVSDKYANVWWRYLGRIKEPTTNIIDHVYDAIIETIIHGKIK